TSCVVASHVLHCGFRWLPSSPLSPYTSLFRSRAFGSGYSGTCTIGFDRQESGLQRSGITLILQASGPACRTRRVIHEARGRAIRSEEHTSELQSREKLVCRILLEKKKLLEETS